MKASALVRSPLKRSGGFPIVFAALERGRGVGLGGTVGRAGIGPPPPGGPPSPGGPPAPGGPPGPGGPPPPPPSPGGFPPPSYGLHSGGWLVPASSVRLKALSKAVASFSSVSVVVWVTMAGGEYFWANFLVQAGFGGRFSWETVGLFLICSSGAFCSESSIDCSEAGSLPLSG